MSRRILFFPDGTYQVVLNGKVNPQDYPVGTYCHTPKRDGDGQSVWVWSRVDNSYQKVGWYRADNPPADLQAQAFLLG